MCLHNRVQRHAPGFCCFGASLPTTVSPAPEAQHRIVMLLPRPRAQPCRCHPRRVLPKASSVGTLPIHRGALRARHARMLSEGLCADVNRAIAQLAGFRRLAFGYWKRFAAVPNGLATLTSAWLRGTRTSGTRSPGPQRCSCFAPSGLFKNDSRMGIPESQTPPSYHGPISNSRGEFAAEAGGGRKKKKKNGPKNEFQGRMAEAE